MNRGGECLVLMIVFILAMASVSAIPQTINIHGRLSNSSEALEGSFSMNFSIYNVSSGGSYLYKKVMSVTTDSSGVYNVILDNVNLNFSEQYFLGIAVEDDEEMSPRINLTSSPYAYMAQNVSVGGIIYDGNMELGNKNITTTGTGFFGFLGSLVTRITKLWVEEINATGNIVTMGNVSAGYFIGNGSLLVGLPISGGSGSGAGWVNDSLNTNTSLNVNVFGNLNVTGLIYGNASQMVGLPSGGIWTDVSGIATYDGGLNVTGTARMDTINSSSVGNVTITSIGGSIIIKLG